MGPGREESRRGGVSAGSGERLHRGALGGRSVGDRAGIGRKSPLIPDQPARIGRLSRRARQSAAGRRRAPNTSKQPGSASMRSTTRWPTPLATGHTAAAKGAAQILGDSGDARLLTRDGANPSPLVQALRSSDRRLRVAAVEAVMKLKPTMPFAGSSYLTDALADMIGATGHRRAAIAFPTLESLQELAGMTNAAGFQTETATNGRQLFAAAAESPDTELILISADQSSERRGTRATIARRSANRRCADLRDGRTRRARICRAGDGPLSGRVRRAASTEPRRNEAHRRPRSAARRRSHRARQAAAEAGRSGTRLVRYACLAAAGDRQCAALRTGDRADALFAADFDPRGGRDGPARHAVVSASAPRLGQHRRPADRRSQGGRRRVSPKRPPVRPPPQPFGNPAPIRPLQPKRQARQGNAAVARRAAGCDREERGWRTGG